MDGARSLGGVEQIGDFSALVIRSRTQVTRDVLAAGKKLKVVGRAGVGVDNVDLDEATHRGIIVMNTPDGNTLSTAEHTISMMLAMARRIPFADRTMKAGRWEKKSITGVEMFDKTLGICGLGRIGREVARRAAAFGMKIVGYDPFFSKDAAEKLQIELVDDVDDLVKAADIITVHTPMTPETKGLIDKRRIEIAKPGVMIVNCARGGIVDEQALLDGLKSGKVAGAALDVFETEPLAEDHPFRAMDNVVLTPHLAASTTEAQENVARDVARQIADALRGTVVRNAVNAPSIDSQTLKRVGPYMKLSERMGRFLAHVARTRISRLEVAYSGLVCDNNLDPITTAAVKGLLDPRVSEPVNFVNARHRAKSRGIDIVETQTSEAKDYTSLITLKALLEDGGERMISGTLFGLDKPRIVNVNGIEAEVAPEGSIIMVTNEDKPGALGAVASKLGAHQVNIAEMALGRVHAGGRALTFICVDGDVKEQVLTELRALPNIVSVDLIVC
ncbi:MAG: D-3-phosphoglycerate dehydrogenase [candidate division BRC1 bacterium ADurb.BinA364]|nr:MAG: D-3-phosphoglycerate dehydrogenase [candidate division BRC1 bacterium ADurb.BinA364]